MRGRAVLQHRSPLSSQARATAIGGGAILLWASLATLTMVAGQVPAFELTAITFAIAGASGLAVAAARGRLAAVVPPLPVLALGVSGLFGEHALYFGALRLAPPSQAGLIVGLWPLLMVLLTVAVLRERLRPNHVIGLLMGALGVLTLTIGTNEGGLAFEMRYLPGYLLAFGAAAVWAGYSVLSRRHAAVPTESVVSFCMLTAVLAAGAHLMCERPAVMISSRQAAAILALGLGPVGLAFFVWDHGVKRGSIRVLGVVSYAAPILSTLVLVATGFAKGTTSLGISCLLIAGAAASATTSNPERLTKLLSWPRLRSSPGAASDRLITALPPRGRSQEVLTG